MPDANTFADWPARVVFVPVVGLAVSHAAGLYVGVPWWTARFWAASGYFVLVSLVLWEGNRFGWFRLRGKPDWAVAPRQRFVVVISATLLYTAPTCLGMLWGWFLINGIEPPWPAIGYATLLSSFAAAFIVHIYETVDLIKQRAKERVTREKLENAKALAELAMLKSHIGPHFMFNCLNTLAGLIETSPERATEFTTALASVYRYILENRNVELVPLEREIEFLANYHALLQLRFGNAIQMTIPHLTEGAQIPPVSLQVLLENAAKHNDFSPESPLPVVLRVEDDRILMRNPIREARPSNNGPGLGLESLDHRCRLVMGRGIEVDSSNGHFSVHVPLVRS